MSVFDSDSKYPFHFKFIILNNAVLHIYPEVFLQMQYINMCYELMNRLSTLF